MRRHLLIWILSFTFITTFIHVSDALAKRKVKLEEGTLVILRTTEPINPQVLGVGDIVKLEVAQDVVVDGVVVIKAGTPALGEIVIAEKEGYIGKAGKINIAVSSTKAVDGQKVPLRGHLRREGESKQVESIAISVVLCPLGLLMKGEAAQIPSGSQMKAYVDNTIMVEVE
jgi:hypothetical protein